MILSPLRIDRREKVILAGLYLSRYDLSGLRSLGFDSFKEAFNVIGYALGSKPATIKNYRDEFDPLYSNPRKGWHKRPIREYCMKLAKTYGSLDQETFTDLIKSFLGESLTAWKEPADEIDLDENAQFAKRVTTGLAAEQYFELTWPRLQEFSGYTLQKTTQLGCGYDYRLSTNTGPNFLAVEVKGLRERTGSLAMTQKEYDTAVVLRDRFFLFVVKNFQENPFHEIFRDPVTSGLSFRRNEVVTVSVSWVTNV